VAIAVTPTDIQQELVALAREFAANEIRPVAAHYDETEETPLGPFRKAAEIGLTSYDLPERFGGGGIEDLGTITRIHEELTYGDAAIGNFIGSASFFGGVIVELGTEQQAERWITPLCGPDPKLGALATTEPQAGSDASAIATHAQPVDGGYLLNGSKTWISNAGVASYYLVFATVAPGTRSKGITAFVVEDGDEGFEVGQKLHKLGQRAIPTHEIFFKDVHLPEDRRIGDEGMGFKGLMRKFDESRVVLAAGEVGMARAAFDYAVEYATEREAFGAPIHVNQAVSFRLVDVKMKMDQARLLVRHAAALADAGEDFSTEAAMAKLAASEAAWFSAWACCQTLGGYSYSREYPAERWLRDAKLEEIWEGTSDIMRLIISRSLFPRV
jgi:acyl-CoA dehydrogenase